MLLDTHAWLWWVSAPERLGTAARDAVTAARASGELLVSAISAWEAAMLLRKGRLELTMPIGDLVAHCERFDAMRFVPVDARIAVAATALEPLHGDPADRLIVATARALGASVVTKDARLHAFDGVRCVW
jgi:PIN domain nuclease of toxin-antitoxin system